MKKFLLVWWVTAFITGSAGAQNTPKVEVFGGYSLLNEDVGGLFSPSTRVNIHGWNAAAAGNISRWLALAADFSGHYRPNADASLHTFTFGPQISYRGKDKVTPFARLLFGGAHNRQATSFAPFTFSDTAFALNLGFGLDWNASERVGIRVIQYDAVLIPAGLSGHNRFSFGVVFKFGKK